MKTSDSNQLNRYRAALRQSRELVDKAAKLNNPKDEDRRCEKLHEAWNILTEALELEWHENGIGEYSLDLAGVPHFRGIDGRWHKSCMDKEAVVRLMKKHDDVRSIKR